jgi:hypothetical protein
MKTSALNVTNVTPSSTKTLTLYDMEETVNYGPDRKATRCDYTNGMASSTDALENFAFFCSKTNVNPFKPTVTHPSQARVNASKKGSNSLEGIQYGVILDDIITETDTTDAAYRVDYPVRIEIRITQQNHPAVTNAQVRQLLGRAVSTLIKEDNTDRLAMLRANSLSITAD